MNIFQTLYNFFTVLGLSQLCNMYMRLFVFLFLTVTSLSIAKAQNTSCQRLAEGSAIRKVSIQCSSDGPQIEIEYGSIYVDTARDAHEVLLLLLRVQRTEEDRYTPAEMRNLIEYLVPKVSTQLWEGFALWGRVLPEESAQKMLDMHSEFETKFHYPFIFFRDFPQSKLDELHDWLVSNKIGDFFVLDPLVTNDCPITGDLSPILRDIQECIEQN